MPTKCRDSSALTTTLRGEGVVLDIATDPLPMHQSEQLGTDKLVIPMCTSLCSRRSTRMWYYWKR